MSRVDSKADMAAADREDYYQRLAARQLAPLWTFFHDWFTPVPRVSALPYRWRYADLRDIVLESARLIDPAEAERRVAVLENPGLAGRRLVTPSLYAGLQVIMPGEIAPCHRHSPVALRFVIEGRGAYTAINGERAFMNPGDMIVTPPWTWHEHGHEGEGPTVWLDVLDVAMIHLFNASFAELKPGETVSPPVPPGTSRFRYGMNMRPAAAGSDRILTASPIFSYPYARVREVLELMRDDGEIDSRHGVKLAYIDPTSGGPAIPTISTAMQLLPAGFETSAYRSTAGTVFCIVEGAGTLTVDSRDDDLETVVFDYAPWDIIVVPGWATHRFVASSETIAFSASDEVAQRKLGFFREEHGPPDGMR